MEIFKDIKDYEGLYQISNLGNVKSFVRVDNLKKQPTKKKYLSCTLCVNGRKTFLIHRLVALTFIDNPEYKSQVNHINGIKTDNRVENLEWTTPSENVLHSYSNNLASNKGEKNPQSNFTNDEVLFMRCLYSFGMKIKEIAKEFCSKYDTIWSIIKHKNYSHI